MYDAELDMKVYYYHLRFDPKGAVTICYFKDKNGILARGIAACSPSETTFSKSYGRELSYSRAIHAAAGRRSYGSLPGYLKNAYVAGNGILSYKFVNIFNYLAEYKPTISNAEKASFKVTRSD